MRWWNSLSRRGFLQGVSGLGAASAVTETNAVPAQAAGQRPATQGIIIDVHTHTPTHEGPVPESERRTASINRPDRPVIRSWSWQDYMTAMAPVSKALVFGIRRLQPSSENAVEPAGDLNERTARFARAHPEKVIGFMSVHPEEPKVVETMERCVHELGLKGIKLGPNYQQFDPLGRRAFVVYEAAQRMGLPIVFHQGTSPDRVAPLRYAHPLTIDEIAIAFPELRIVMAHMGHPWQTDTICVIRKHPHVYADVSALFYRPWGTYQALMAATEWSVLHKLLFGTDYAVATPQETIDGLLAVNKVVEGTALPRVPIDKVEEIIYRANTLELLGVQA